MNLTSEVELVQNSGLGAIAIWAFAKEFYNERRRTIGPPLPLTTFVMPLVFHEETLEAIRNRRFVGGLFTALAENRNLGVELQERAEAMLPQTLSALNMAFASELLIYRPDIGVVEPARQSPPYRLEAESTRRILSGAERLGYWFATINTPQICSLLNVRF